MEDMGNYGYTLFRTIPPFSLVFEKKGRKRRAVSAVFMENKGNRHTDTSV